MSGLPDGSPEGFTEHDTPSPPELDPTPEELAALEEAFSGELDGLLAQAYTSASDNMEPSRLSVLQRVRAQVDDEDASARRRGRRRALRVLFYVFNLAAVVMIVIAYLGNRMAIRVLELNAQRMATQTEVTALTRALVRYAADHRSSPLPKTMPELLTALAPPEGEPYYPLDVRRRQDGGYLDDFGRPYLFRFERDRALIYSMGPNGQDEAGGGDDVIDRWVTFVR
jgi:hypothetical protein